MVIEKTSVIATGPETVAILLSPSSNCFRPLPPELPGSGPDHDESAARHVSRALQTRRFEAPARHHVDGSHSAR
jgi:hypothetical protein